MVVWLKKVSSGSVFLAQEAEPGQACNLRVV